MQAQQVINFYSHLSRATGWCSNFYPVSIKLTFRGRTIYFETSEHVYQVHKFLVYPKKLAKETQQYIDIIAHVKTPGAAAALGRQTANTPGVRNPHQIPEFHEGLSDEVVKIIKGLTLSEIIDLYQKIGISQRADWEKVKDDVMRNVVRIKFKQNPELAQKLLATGSSVLVEHTKNDKYWGDGGDGTGKNMLGKILMEIRDHKN